LAIAVLCAIATSLSLARSGIVTMIVSVTAVLYASGIWRGRIILIAGIFGAAVIMWVPNVMWARLTVPTESREGYTDARGRIYTAAVEHFPEYAMTGVGAGNFYTEWGFRSNYGYGRRNVTGSHNVFIEVTIYWGLAGLLALMAVVWQAYRCLPRHCGSDPLSLQLLGISVAALIMSLSVHDLYAKDFSLVLGLLVGARRWIWPKGIVQPATWKQRLPRPILARMS
jgi:O-antigen ligase